MPKPLKRKRMALDTERGQMAHDLCDAYGFEFFEQSQMEMFDKYQDCFGNAVWVKEDRQLCMGRIHTAS